ncbi:hypothetical protein Anapl_01618 [Anas platyrhynchos]|uniref:Uncharacterized protein n=1 Tax=Anas platyrhynchos TaxID=8839 RepID=R0LAP8_ANAPL|nr:hypothetical protein Anapl_01618 [Anas platyrhynchos]
MRSLGPCHHAALLLAGSFLLARQRGCAQSRGLGKRERVCDKAQRSPARTQRRGCPGFIVTWNAVKAGKNQASKCSVRPWSSGTLTLAGLLSFVSHRALTEASASFPTSKGEELHMGILSHSQGMSIMTKITKKDRNLLLPLLLFLTPPPPDNTPWWRNQTMESRRICPNDYCWEDQGSQLVASYSVVRAVPGIEHSPLIRVPAPLAHKAAQVCCRPSVTVHIVPVKMKGGEGKGNRENKKQDMEIMEVGGTPDVVMPRDLEEI